MNASWLHILWHSVIAIAYIEASPATGQNGETAPMVVQVLAGETAKLECPSNDDNHRFQFWQLQSNRILGPGNKMDQRKYKYEVLGGTLYIKKVSPEERGLYTCYCKHLVNTTYNARSVMLIVKSDWEKLWLTDTSVNAFRIGMMSVVGAVILLIGYIVYGNIKRDRLMQFKDFTNENASADEISSRKASYSFAKHSKNFEMKQGIDNPALEEQLSRESTPPTYSYTPKAIKY